MKYYIIAGEASGDLHGANLIKGIQQLDANADFRFWGGDRMASIVGDAPVKHIRDLAFMGFVEVLLNLRTILANFKICEKDVEQYSPDVLVLIDYPGFNLKMARFAKERGMKVVYYISPQVWAWKASRVKKIKRYVDVMLCILPFEEDFYAKWDYNVEYVGHPLLDVVEEYERTEQSETLADEPIALIPGSRKQEISKMLPTMIGVAKGFPNEKFEIAAAPAIDTSFYEQFSLPDHVKVVSGVTHNIMQRAKAAMVTSGTATLETALFNTPEVVCYKGSYISYLLAKQLIKVKYISLVNLIMDREVVKELIQGDFTVQNGTVELKQLLNGEENSVLKSDYKELRKLLGGSGASLRAAQNIVDFLHQT